MTNASLTPIYAPKNAPTVTNMMFSHRGKSQLQIHSIKGRTSITEATPKAIPAIKGPNLSPFL